MYKIGFLRLTYDADSGFLCRFESPVRHCPMPGTETPLTSDIFDQLERAMPGDRAGLTELYRDYLADAWETVQFIREAVQRPHQPEEIRQKAHCLKGSSLVLGARMVAQHASILEESARNSGANEECTLDKMIEAIRAVQKELATRLGGEVIPEGRAAA
jgi:HPt (histidine-containing phosphotransfer) domain-containing protein